jgi:biotin operon repressor
MDAQESARLQVKTAEHRFLRVLEQEYHCAPRVAQALLEEAQASLLGAETKIGPGQQRAILAQRRAKPGRSLRDTRTVEVLWTVDAGEADRRVLREHGGTALRQVRIQRLLDEAIDQGGVATQEDLAQALQVSVRTIKRDCAVLEAQGIDLPTRGNLHAIGRGQTHKAQIVGRWLDGETYDQIELHTRHCPLSIRRYVQAFVRVVELHRQHFAQQEIARLLEMSVPLVQEYLAVYAKHDSPAARERLADQLERFSQAAAREQGSKKGDL